MDDLYREIIIERYKEPLFRKSLEDADIAFEDENPLCGDRLKIFIRIDDNQKIVDASFEGHGCAISQASADLLVESIIGKSLDDVKSLAKEDILDMLGIELSPVRLKCALLSLKVLKGGIYGLGSAEYHAVDEE